MALVLAGAIVMPLLTQVTDRFGFLPASAGIVLPEYPMILLEELQARLQAASGSGPVLKPVADPLPAPNPPQAEESAGPARDIRVCSEPR